MKSKLELAWSLNRSNSSRIRDRSLATSLTSSGLLIAIALFPIVRPYRLSRFTSTYFSLPASNWLMFCSKM